MKGFIAKILLLSLLLTSILAMSSCKKDRTYESGSEKPDIFSLDVQEYLSLGQYKGLSIKLVEGESKGEAIWEATVSGSDIISYPQELLDYYIAQTEAQYRYYAEKSGKSYAEVLADYGKTEASLLEDAKRFVKEDLVYAAIVKVEGIEVTEADKAAHFDTFVDQYVSVYGYDKEYVKEKLADVVLDSMLHDKMIEFLILNNSFN